QPQAPVPSGRVLRPAQMGTTPMTAGASAVLGGTYTRTEDRIVVNLKVVDSASQQLLAAYDYSLPLSPDMKDMTLTQDERAQKEKYPVGTFLGLTDK
ncbi:MAG TPA: FlgO family outer membrane protein, partial [Alphaproteobacteria bacterium]